MPAIEEISIPEGKDAAPRGATDRGIVTLLRELLRRTPLPEMGWAWQKPESAWWRLVGQICAVGSARSWAALETPHMREALAPARLRALGGRAEAEIHRALAAAGVRYCSPGRTSSAKAAAIARNAASHWVIDVELRAALLEHLQAEVGAPDHRGCWERATAQEARRVLIREIAFFGPKSASDFLLGLGLAEDLIALDVRILNLLVDGLGWDPRCRRVGGIYAYEAVEAEVLVSLAQPAGMTGVALDRTLFYHYPKLLPLWKIQTKPNERSDQSRVAAGGHAIEGVTR